MSPAKGSGSGGPRAARSAGKGGARASATSPAGPSVLGRGDLANSLMLIFPLFLAYSVGVMFSSTMNGVDFVTHWILVAVGYDRTLYFYLHLGLAGAFVGLLMYLRARQSLKLAPVPLMLLEAAIYALTLGSLIVFVMQNVLGFYLAAPADLALGRVGEAIVTSLGAGVHEELVFRLGMMSGGAALLRALRVPGAILIAVAVSSLVFSGVHHLGPLGDPWELGKFTYRALAGVVFAVIYYYRSLAHAVYTHFLYDVYVLLLVAPS